MIVRHKIIGLEDLHKQLKTLPVRVEKKILQKSVTQALRAHLKQAKAITPVHKRGQRSPASQQYGSWRKNLKVFGLRRLKRKHQRAARMSSVPSFWARFYEVGTKRQKARPVMEPFYNSIKFSVIDKLSALLGKYIEDEARKKS